MKLIYGAGLIFARFTMHGRPRCFAAASHLRLALMIVQHWWKEL